MIEDYELDLWRKQWRTVAGPSPDFQRKIQRRIKLQDRRFLLGNVLTAVAFPGILIFALFVRHQANSLGTGWATAICMLLLVSAGYRVWAMRGTWRPDTQSTRAFVELWHRRVLARLLMLRISIYVALGWLILCAVLTVVNWATIGPEVKAHPRDWLDVLVASVVMQPVIWFWAAWLRRRKTAELNEVKAILDEMDETKD
jgi:hypothetical protein